MLTIRTIHTLRTVEAARLKIALEESRLQRIYKMHDQQPNHFRFSYHETPSEKDIKILERKRETLKSTKRERETKQHRDAGRGL